MSPTVAARRALDLKLTDRNTFFDFHEHDVNREPKGGKTPGGSDFYTNQNSRVGKLFAIQVLCAAMEGRIGFKEAYEPDRTAGEAPSKNTRDGWAWLSHDDGALEHTT